MTAPTLMPSAPAVSSAGRAAGPTGTGSTAPSPGFQSALDDALTGGGSAGEPQTGAADGKPAAEEKSAPDDTPAAPAPVVQPGLWALLSLAQPVPTPAPVTSPTPEPTTGAAADASIGAVPAPAVPAVPEPAAGTTSVPLPGVLATDTAPVGPAPTGAPAGPGAAADTPFSVVLGDVVPAGKPAGSATGTTTGSTTGTDAGPATPGLTDVLLQTSSGGGADTSGTTSDGAGDGAATASAPTAGAPDDTVFALPSTAPTSTTSAVADAAAPVPAGDDTPVAAQLGRQLAVLTNAPDGAQTMTLIVSPDELGPVSIQATITGGSLDLTLHGAHEHGRHALVEALPDLRRDLESAGLSVNRLEVGADATGGDTDPWARAQQQLADSQHGRPGQPAAGARSWARTDDPQGAGTTAPTSDLSASSGVDVRV